MLAKLLMPSPIRWEQQIGRRVKLRDLFVFFAVVEHGSMAKAGAKLGVTTPSISDVIAGLEHALGVRLLDRSPRGVVTTPYGEALLARARAAFDELRQGIKDIEFIGDPHAGELRIGSPESITAGLLLPVILRLKTAYPRVRYQVQQVQQPTIEYPELHERKVDLVIARWGKDPVKGHLDRELDTEILLNDPFFLVASGSSQWARRRRIDLGDLTDAPLIIPPADAWGGALVTDAFRRRGLGSPNIVVSTLSIPLRNELVATGQFITLLPASVIRTFDKRYDLKVLPIELPAHRSPVGIVTLKNRTLAPVVQLFIQSARQVVQSIAGRPGLPSRW
jgi:DNA-binding transcriptional LysR family regulator